MMNISAILPLHAIALLFTILVPGCSLFDPMLEVIDDSDLTVPTEEKPSPEDVDIVFSTSGIMMNDSSPFTVQGPEGGPFPISMRTYRLRNDTDETIEWTGTTNTAWLVISPAGGQVAPEESAAFLVTLDEEHAAHLEPNTYEAAFEVTGSSAAGAASRWFLEVLSRDTVPGPDSEPGPVPDMERVTDGLIAHYEFEEAQGAMVHDTSGSATPIDLAIADPENTTWVPGGLAVHAATRIQSPEAATPLVRSLVDTNALTVEAWLESADPNQTGPARIVSIAGLNSTFDRNFMLGQGLHNSAADQISVRLNTTSNGSDGTPGVATGPGSFRTQTTHVVVTRESSGDTTVYLDGEASGTSQITGTLDTWDPEYLLTLANEADTDRPWLGTFYQIAMYDRALTAEEVVQNFSAGTQIPQSGHLVVTPEVGLAASGPPAGPLVNTMRDYQLTNTGDRDITWTASVDKPWIQLSERGGTLAPGDEALVTVAIDEALANLHASDHDSATVSLTNETDGIGTATRLVTLDRQRSDVVEKPGAHNTGPTDHTSLTPWERSNTITTEGITIENKIFTGTVTIEADNVTIRNFIIDAQNSAPYGLRSANGNTGGLFENGEVLHATSAGIFGGGFTLRRLNIHDCGGDAMKLRDNAVAEFCWLHHLGTNEGAHADGNQTRIGSNITMRYCNFDMPAPELPNGPGEPYKSNAASINQSELGDIHNLVMEGNWLNGGNYTVYFTGKDDSPFKLYDCKLIDNHFGRDFRYGAVRIKSSKVVNLTVSGNRWEDTGELMSIND